MGGMDAMVGGPQQVKLHKTETLGSGPSSTAAIPAWLSLLGLLWLPSLRPFPVETRRSPVHHCVFKAKTGGTTLLDSARAFSVNCLAAEAAINLVRSKSRS